MKIFFSYWATISLTAVKWAKMKSKPTYYKGKRKLNTNTTTCLDFNQNILVVNHCIGVGRGRGAGAHILAADKAKPLSSKRENTCPSRY